MFSTQIDIPHSAVEITYNDRILTLGSCFAENIGTKLQEAFFLTFINHVQSDVGRTGHSAFVE